MRTPVTHAIRAQWICRNVIRRLRLADWVHASCLVALCCGSAFAQEQGPPIDEVAVSTERQNALANESIALTTTPDVGPHLSHTRAVVAQGAFSIRHTLDRTGTPW